ncbi:hypothetical protein ABZP36_002717 [Zizania latifolia]
MATKTPQTPRPAAGAILRRSVPPSPLSMLSPSFSQKPFRAATPLSFPSECDERPCVTLSDWWLERVEGDDRKILVAGFTERNRRAHVFTSAPIVKRYEACTLETEDGIIVLIHGSLDFSQMRKNGYSLEACEKFMIGFPCFWENCNMLYPKTDNSCIGSLQGSSNASNSREGSTKFYLEKFQLGNFIDSVGSSFIMNLLNNAKSSSGGDADAFEEYPNLANKTPRFEEYTRDLDIPAEENAAVFNNGSKGPTTLCDKVDNEKTDLIVESASKERDHGNIYLNESLASQEEFTSDETSKEAVNQNDTVHPNTIEQEPSSHLVISDLMYNRYTDNMPCDTENGNGNAGRSVGQGSKEFVATVPLERANCSCEIAGCSDNILPTSMSKSKGCPEIAQHITLNEEVAPHDDMPTSVHSDVQSLGNLTVPEKEKRSEHDVLLGATRSPMIRTPRPYVSMKQRSDHGVLMGATRSANPSVPCSRITRAKAKSLPVSTPEFLKLRRTRSGRVVVPWLDPSCQRIVYDGEGSVSGVVGLEFESALKGRKSGTSVRKKRAH